MSSKKAFLYTVNLYDISQNFRDTGKGDKYYEYHSKGFYGAVIRSWQKLQSLDGEQVVIMPHPRFSDGSFRGVNIDIIPKDDQRINKYNLDPQSLLEINLQVEKNPGNIVINDQSALASLFFHDHDDKETTIINFIKNGIQ